MNRSLPRQRLGPPAFCAPAWGDAVVVGIAGALANRPAGMLLPGVTPEPFLLAIATGTAQRCPTRALSIALADHRDAAESREKEEGLPGHPDEALCLPDAQACSSWAKLTRHLRACCQPAA